MLRKKTDHLRSTLDLVLASLFFFNELKPGALELKPVRELSPEEKKKVKNIQRHQGHDLGDLTSTKKCKAQHQAAVVSPWGSGQGDMAR